MTTNNSPLPADIDWSLIPTMEDLPPPPKGAFPMPQKAGEGAFKGSMPSGREPTDYERTELADYDRKIQEIHQDKMRVAAELYKATVMLADDTLPHADRIEAGKAGESLLAMWNDLCGRELKQAMRAQTLQAFSKRRLREEREDKFKGEVALGAIGAAQKPLDEYLKASVINR